MWRKVVIVLYSVDDGVVRDVWSKGNMRSRSMVSRKRTTKGATVGHRSNIGFQFWLL